MPEFLKLIPPDEARALLLRSLPEVPPAVETIRTVDALDRVTAHDILAPHPLPEFTRSTMDGYAVSAKETFGASESLPAYLTLVGEVPMGIAPELSLKLGQCALIHTGGMLPQGADAVVMLEYTQRARKHAVNSAALNEIEILRPVAEGENTICIGEDAAEGQVIIPKGTRIRPAEIGGLMALGFTELAVSKKPRVGIISSGDEVLPPSQSPRIGQVRDINTYSLSAVVQRTGGEPVSYGILPDDLAIMRTEAARALAECDLVIVTAGSSASARDMTAEAINSLGSPGVLVHGVNVKPGKPTILAICDKKAVIGLPGNPVSALVIAGLFVVPVIEKLLALSERKFLSAIPARLMANVPSQAGREDWVAVKLVASAEGWLAEPIFGKSNQIFLLVSANGLVHIPPAATGLIAGDAVEVVLI